MKLFNSEKLALPWEKEKVPCSFIPRAAFPFMQCAKLFSFFVLCGCHLERPLARYLAALRVACFFDAAVAAAAFFLAVGSPAGAVPGFGRNAARNSATGRVLITSAAVSQPRRAMVTP